MRLVLAQQQAIAVVHGASREERLHSSRPSRLRELRDLVVALGVPVCGLRPGSIPEGRQHRNRVCRAHGGRDVDRPQPRRVAGVLATRRAAAATRPSTPRLNAAAMPSGVRPSADDASTCAPAATSSVGDVDQTLERDAGKRRLTLRIGLVGDRRRARAAGSRRATLIVISGEHQQRVTARGGRVDGHPGVESALERIEVPAAGGIGRHAREPRVDLGSDNHARAGFATSPPGHRDRGAAAGGDALERCDGRTPASALRKCSTDRAMMSSRDTCARLPAMLSTSRCCASFGMQAVQIARLLEVVYFARHLRIVAQTRPSRQSRRTSPRWSAPGRQSCSARSSSRGRLAHGRGMAPSRP